VTPVERLLAGRRIVICAGPGGVGKTTTAAALAMGLAERGLRVAVVTIDPARRLAAALGVPDLGNEPTRIDPTRFTPHGVQLRGELWALMLDPKRTFDALVERLAPDARTRDEVLANRIYQQLSSAVAGAQEFSAVAKLYELDQAGRFDLLVLDTPPSRNALDFLDAPARVAAFFHGRAIRLFLRPAGLGSRIIGRGTGVLFGLMERVTGVDLLHDVSGFFRSVGGLIDGFLERARHVGELLQDPETVFLVVTAPRHDPVEEAIFLHRRLRSAGMPVGGLVVNRVHEAP
jgi:anion-transporting  ArsA/GET3 family ATPase